MKLIKGLIIITTAAILLTACRPAKAHAETVKRYATQTISLKDKAGGKSLSSYLNERLTKSVEVLLVDGVFPHCRVCGGKIQHLMYGKVLSYCPFCGRGLDWSDMDKE